MINLIAFKAFHRTAVQQKQLDKDFQNLKTKLHNFSRTYQQHHGKGIVQSPDLCKIIIIIIIISKNIVHFINLVVYLHEMIICTNTVKVCL